MKLGDAVARVATPIARTLGLDCIDPETQNLRPDAPCNKRIVWLNNFGESVLTYFGYVDRGEKIMKYVVTKQIEVEAETPEEAVAKAGEGKTISLQVQVRPQAPSVAFPGQGQVPIGQLPVKS